MPTSDYFDAKTLDGACVISFSRSDVTDQVYIKNLGDSIYHHIKPIEKPRVVVDLHNVQFMSSAAIGMLLALKTVVSKLDGQIRIANVDDRIRELFKLTKFHKVIKIAKSTDDAVSSMK